MSAKVKEGLSWFSANRSFLSKRPLPIGGWFCETLQEVFINTGWGWDARHDVEYGGAVLVAPLPILFWEKE